MSVFLMDGSSMGTRSGAVMGDLKNMTESELVAKLLELCGERDILAEKLAMLNKEEECLRREYNTDWIPCERR